MTHPPSAGLSMIHRICNYWLSKFKQVYRRRYESRRSPNPKLHQENEKSPIGEIMWTNCFPTQNFTEIGQSAAELRPWLRDKIYLVTTIFNMAAVCHVEFSKFTASVMRPLSPCYSASPCETSLKSDSRLLIVRRIKSSDCRIHCSLNPLMGTGNYSAHRMIWSWYTGRWWAGCYIWYSEEGPGRAGAPPSPLLAVPNVTARPSTASVPTSYYSMCTVIPCAH